MERAAGQYRGPDNLGDYRGYVWVVVFYTVLLIVFVLNTFVLKLPANATEVLLYDLPPAQLQKADLFFPEKNPFVYKEIPITIRLSPTVSSVNISPDPTLSGVLLTGTLTVSLDISPTITFAPTTTIALTPSVSGGITPTISATTITATVTATPTPTPTPSNSGGTGDTPTPTPTSTGS